GTIVANVDNWSGVITYILLPVKCHKISQGTPNLTALFMLSQLQMSMVVAQAGTTTIIEPAQLVWGNVVIGSKLQ
ncbi:MAG: hypothetical protein IPH46_14990, partial [Bacteroidetes bacterium]|nr:hypothetical protein [Bacteroidota bacterium]